MLKKIFKGLGITLLVLVVIFASISGWFYLKSSEYEKTAVPYIEAAIPELSKWDAAITKTYMAPEALASTNDEELEKLMRFLSKMGALKTFDKPQFQNATSSATTNDGAMTILIYNALAHYENGDANISIRLKETGKKYEIYSFNLSSKSLLE